MSPAKKRRSRKTYTEEEKAAFAAADAARNAAADDGLKDPQTVEQVVTHAQRTGSPRFLGYSLRNQMLVFQQAAARGITLTDIDTKDEWRKRGRKPNQLGLKICVPSVGRNDAGEEELRGWIMSSVFDISMTDPIDGAETVPAPAVEDPTGMLWENLVEQAGKLGLRVAHTDAPDRAGMDTDAGTVTVTEGQPVTELARLLGPLIVQQSQGKRDARRERENPPGLPLDIGEFGTVYMTERADLENARVYYDVASRRANGTFTVVIDDAHLADRPARLGVIYGEDDGSRGHRFRNEYPKLPVVNGITIVGATHGINADTVGEISGWRINVWEPTGYLNNTRQAPPRTTERVAAIVRALLLHFLARPDLDQLHRASVARQAPIEGDRKRAEAASIDKRIAELIAERDRQAAAAAQFDAQAAAAREGLAS
ncbi:MULTISPECIES: hypothetical protein [unclassified Nocardia]|uniref:hypothetical protein n=1 Tax=unclassified Nocardia TaxID=2637762 RepID=UPI00278BE9D9|nr:MULTISPECIES: hypothetical protein [unclassified Nocardia]